MVHFPEWCITLKNRVMPGSESETVEPLRCSSGSLTEVLYDSWTTLRQLFYGFIPQ